MGNSPNVEVEADDCGTTAMDSDWPILDASQVMPFYFPTLVCAVHHMMPTSNPFTVEHASYSGLENALRTAGC